MLHLRFAAFLIFIYLLIFQSSIIECRPHTQRIIIHGHEWTVPDEPGWEDIVKKADLIRHQLLSNCATIRACRLAAEKLRELFINHQISSNYYDDSRENNVIENDDVPIFKWG